VALLDVSKKKNPHIQRYTRICFAPPIGESYNFDAMAIYLTIRKTNR